MQRRRMARWPGRKLWSCRTLGAVLFTGCLVVALHADDSTSSDGKTAVRTRTDREIWSRKISLNMQNAPLIEVLEQIAKQVDIPLRLDTEALKEGKVDLKRINQVTLTNVELNLVLANLMWRQRPSFVAAHAEVRDGALFVTTITAHQERFKQALPEWLRATFVDHHFQVQMDQDRQITSLQLYRPLTDELLGQIATLTKLRQFEIHGSAEFTATGAAAFAKMGSLETLKVSSSRAPADLPNLWDVVMEQLSEVESLRSLDLAETGITDQGLAAVCRRGQLTSLRLYQEGRLTDLAMESIASQSHLKRLDLTTYVSTPLGLMNFSREATQLLTNLEEVEDLILPGQGSQTEIFDFPHLRSLKIAGSRFEAADAANIARCLELTSLNLSYSQIDDIAFKWLADHPKLSRLQIRAKGICDDVFSHLKRTSKLKEIHLRTNGLTDRSLEHFAAMKFLTHLSLNWGTNSFTPEGLMGLADSASLKSLELRIIPSGQFTTGIHFKEPDVTTPVTLVLPASEGRPQLTDNDRERLPFNLDPVLDALPKLQVTVTHDEFPPDRK